MTPVEPRINFAALQSQFGDLTAQNAVEFRQRTSEIAARVALLLTGDGDVDPPAQPEGFTATGGVLSAVCTWQAAERAILYRVYRSLQSAPSAATEVGITPSLTFTDVGVAAGDYLYYVVAENVDGDLSTPSESDGTTVTSGTPGTPTTPTGLALSVVGDGQVTPFSVDVSWDALAAGTVSVRLERAFGATSVNFETIASGVAATTVNDPNVQEQQTYRYRVYGVAADGSESSVSAAVNVTIPASDTVPPPVPQNPTTSIGDRTILLGWDPVVASDLARYEWGIGTSTGTYTTITSSGLDTEVLISGLTNAEIYYLAVRSVDASNNASAWSTERVATPLPSVPDSTPPAAPADLQLGFTASGEVNLQWSGNTESDLSLYRIYQSSPPSGSSTGPWVQVGTVAGGLEEFEETLTQDGTYYYYITAVDGYGNESAASSVVSGVISGGSGDPGPGDPNPGGEVPVDGNSGGNSATAGITAQSGTGSTVLQYSGNSSAQNAALFIPGIQDARAARTAGTGQTPSACADAWPGVIGDGRFESDWQWVHNYSTFDCTWPFPAQTNVCILDNNGYYADPANFEDIKWFIRRFNVPGSITQNCDFIGGLFYTGSGDPAFNLAPGISEHADYDSPHGSSVRIGNTATNLGGHFHYAAHRPYDTAQYQPDNSDYTSPPLYLVQNCHAHNTDMDPSRGGGSLQFFDHGNPTHPGTIIVRNCTFVQAWPFRSNDAGDKFSIEGPAPAGTYRARSICDVTQYAFCNNFQTGTAGVRPNPGTYDRATDPHVTGLFLWQNNLIDLTEANDRPCIGLEGILETRFENSLWITRDSSRGEILLNPNHDAGRLCKPCGTVRFRNCKRVGGTQVRLRTAAGTTVDLSYALDSENYEYVFNGVTGALISEGPWSPANATDPAPLINAINPFNGMNLAGFTLDWGIDGVTV